MQFRETVDLTYSFPEIAIAVLVSGTTREIAPGKQLNPLLCRSRDYLVLDNRWNVSSGACTSFSFRSKLTVALRS